MNKRPLTTIVTAFFEARLSSLCCLSRINMIRFAQAQPQSTTLADVTQRSSHCQRRKDPR